MRNALSVAILLIGSVSASGADWHWQLAPERYKQMNAFERAQYDKAAHLLETNQAAAASSEFEKFKAQFGDSPVLSYCLFMRGYCLQQAKNRNAAIKAYQEVVDYFPEQAPDAAAALYFEGVANFENGEISKGIRCMKQLLDNPLYKTNLLAAGALRRIADAYWEQKQPDQAVQYWRQAIKEFQHVNDQEYTAALSGLAGYCIISKDYVIWENSALEDDATKQDPVRQRGAADFLWNRGWNMYRNGFERIKPVSEKELAAEQKAFYEYLAKTKPWWIKAKDLNGYYYRIFNVLVYDYKDKETRDKLLDEAIAFERQQTDKTVADQQIAQICDTLRQGRLEDRARLCVAALTDRVLAAWKEHEILCDEGKWKEALATMEQVEASSSPEWQTRAMSERARIYKDALGQYDKAIAIYEKIGQPPATLWQIQDAYKRWGKLDQSLKTLTEIENLFPDDAPRALWYKATYYKEAGDKKRAMAQAHRLLKNYPKAPEVSSAHIMLVAYGEPNFGGETDDAK
ncbi:MAG TPA: tetratricopeptide repeat protein [Tepidisphaeraceae bacterium]|jgi:tetratricopeptide (TPR) repeat protein|nr:tetratricopeptide repeat protein [Tepidisphaeraceae bacterium]